jgi:hypothetical protein
MGLTQSPGVPKMDPGRRASASIGVRSGHLRADTAAGSPGNRADGTVEPGSGPVAAAVATQIAAYPTIHDIRHLAAIDIVAHGAVQHGTAAHSAATPADDQTPACPTATID